MECCGIRSVKMDCFLTSRQSEATCVLLQLVLYEREGQWIKNIFRQTNNETS
jgi:hypothetical protein